MPTHLPAPPTPKQRAALGLATAVLWALVGAASSPASLVAQLLALSGLLVAAAIIVDGAGLRALLVPVRASSVALGIGGGVLMAGLTHAGYRAAVALVPQLRGEVRALYQLLGATSLPPSLLVPAIAVVVVAEELVWRGVVLGTGREVRALRPWLGALFASSLAYGIGDLAVGGPLLAAAALGCGIVWGALRVLRGELVSVIFVHLVWDLLVLGLVPLEARDLTP